MLFNILTQYPRNLQVYILIIILVTVHFKINWCSLKIMNFGGNIYRKYKGKQSFRQIGTKKPLELKCKFSVYQWENNFIRYIVNSLFSLSSFWEYYHMNISMLDVSENFLKLFSFFKICGFLCVCYSRAISIFLSSDHFAFFYIT